MKTILTLALAGILFTLPSLHAQEESGAIPLAKLLEEFRKDSAAATQKYDGERIRVVGRVGQINNSPDQENSVLAIYLQEAQDTTPDVLALFAADDLPFSASLNVSGDGSEATLASRNRSGDVVAETPFATVGEVIEVAGTFHGFIAGDIVLKDSRKLRHRRAAE